METSSIRTSSTPALKAARNTRTLGWEEHPPSLSAHGWVWQDQCCGGPVLSYHGEPARISGTLPHWGHASPLRPSQDWSDVGHWRDDRVTRPTRSSSPWSRSL